MYYIYYYNYLSYFFFKLLTIQKRKIGLKLKNNSLQSYEKITRNKLQ